MKQLILILMMAGILSGCLVGPKINKSTPEGLDTYQFQSSGTSSNDSATVLKWSAVYQDPALQALITTALKNNKDLLTAMARVDEARAASGFSKADLLPNIGYSAGASVLSLSNQTANDLGVAQRNLYHGMGVVSWEIDLWGKVRHANRAALAELISTEESRKAVTSSLVSQVAILYFQLRGLDQRLAIAHRTLEIRKEGTRIITLRFKGGDVAELDKFQAETQEAIAAALVPSLERQVKQTENALSVLLGKIPGAIERGLENKQQMAVQIPAGLPSALLVRRPDVQQAEQAWIAQNERIGVAQAARYPSINLTGALGAASNELSSLTSSGSEVWHLAGSVTGPIFNFNKNKRRVEIERARMEQTRLQYEKVSLNAFAEVENALIAIDTYAREYEARARQVEASQGATNLSRERYNNGYTTFLEVLDNERTLLDAELQASVTLQEQLQATVQLYKALGGGWD